MSDEQWIGLRARCRERWRVLAGAAALSGLLPVLGDDSATLMLTEDVGPSQSKALRLLSIVTLYCQLSARVYLQNRWIIQVARN